MTQPPPSKDGARPIRVMLVDDSATQLELLRRMVEMAPGLQVVGTAVSGVDALRQIPRVAPDVLVTDFSMPGMDGLELVTQVIARHPLPILVVSAWLHPHERQTVFRLLEAGALEVMAKPTLGLDGDFVVASHELTRSIRILSGVRVIRKRKLPTLENPVELRPAARGHHQIVGIGASTGGPQVLHRLLGVLPADYPFPIVCVQHIAEGFAGGLVDWLASTCRIKVITASEGTTVAPGTVYFPPDDRHIEVDENGRLRCSRGVAISGHRPSADVVFSSLALHYKAAAVGVLLTGMGEDGAEGLLAISRAGGTTIAQNEESSVVFGMPRRAIELGAAKQVLSVDMIASTLLNLR